MHTVKLWECKGIYNAKRAAVIGAGHAQTAKATDIAMVTQLADTGGYVPIRLCLNKREQSKRLEQHGYLRTVVCAISTPTR